MSDPIRQAASVVAVRDGDEGPEILVVERSPDSRFLPSYVVFPGGAVDEEDAVLAHSWFGSPEEAARAAAVRELIEEAGLALTADGLVVAADRSDDQDGLGAVALRPPRTSQLSALCHWVAPDDVPVRFDARYFAVRAPHGVDPVADGSEAVRAWWIGPGQLLAEWERGERKLYWPTWFTVSQLADCPSADAVLALSFETQEPDDEQVERLPRSVFWQD